MGAEGRRLSLWLVPPEPIHTTLKSVMDAVAVQHGLPKFEPHVTLIGNVGSLNEAEAHANLLKLQGCGVVPIVYEGDVTAGRNPPDPAPWNQAAICVVNENEPLLRVHRLARAIFMGIKYGYESW